MKPTLAEGKCWLGDKDSNLDKQSQSLLSCRWTIPQRRREYIHFAAPGQLRQPVPPVSHLLACRGDRAEPSGR